MSMDWDVLAYNWLDDYCILYTLTGQHSTTQCTSPLYYPCESLRFYYRRNCTVLQGSCASFSGLHAPPSTELLFPVDLACRTTFAHLSCAGGIPKQAAQLFSGDNPKVYLTSASIATEDVPDAFPDSTASHVSWGQSALGGCSKSVYLGSRSNMPGVLSYHIVLLDNLLGILTSQ